MAIDSEVLVIGGGLAGITAALAAARDGADVRLVSSTQSTLRMASGLVDVLGYVDGEGPVVDPFEAVRDLHADHPYRLLGVDTLRKGLSLFDDAVPGYEGAHTDRNALVPTHGGTIKPTSRYPRSVAAGIASAEGDVLLVGFETVTDFDAPLAGRHLVAAGVPFATDGVTIPFPGDVRADATLTTYARMLDDDAPVEIARHRVGVRRAIAERVKPHLDGQERVGFPALLGDEGAAAVREDVEDSLGAAVFEVPMGPPSLPGIRLEKRLFGALDDAGVHVDAGNPIVSYEGNGAIDHVVMDRNGAEVPYRADQFVLATGGLVGKGIESNRGTVFEPIFDLHVPHSRDRYEWFEDDVFGNHPFAGFGVDVGTDLRPRDARGDPAFDNLRAAGSVIGGFDPAAEKSGSGVSIATGYAAGRAAARDVVT